ncbi:Agamous-like MADS-box protein AGL62 [Acorus gramineus]|uniref:Agamous-like MADS-box protein AGL62 n=1 Tax=Acorus gramineus TaxID=55184 RepID=A0AAV9B084_ACOGR|nr:Agamous-like MADS-box protein AGL62 [Acorus gramineus]
MARKPGTGRKRIEIKPIKSGEARQVCFSKRHVGIFKKASELTVMCGADVGVVTYSPGGNPFTFGHPSIDSISDRLLRHPRVVDDQLANQNHHHNVQQLNQEHLNVLNGLEEKKKIGEELRGKLMRHRFYNNYWRGGSIEELGLEQLERIHATLLDIRKVVPSPSVDLVKVAMTNPQVAQLPYHAFTSMVPMEGSMYQNFQSRDDSGHLK